MPMRRRFLISAILLCLLAALVAWFTHGIGFTAHATPSWVEATLLTGARRWATPTAAHTRSNPVQPTSEVLRAAMAHWADHCASCHGNDGTGTPLGRRLYPPAPDMRAAGTQRLTDGDLFYIIEHGVPWTGMPAWSNGTEGGEHDSWALVALIRRLSALTQQDLNEMERMNPKSPAQLEQDRQADDFLKGHD